MKFFKLNALMAAAVATLAVASASANPTLGNAGSNGNSSLSFVAINTAWDTSLTVDLGVSLASFLPQVSGLTFSGGTLGTGPVTASWNFAANTYTLNGSTQSLSANWSNVGTFLTGAGANGYQWGVIGGDSVSGLGASGAETATNLLQNQNVVYTAVANDFDGSNASGTSQSSIGGAATNYDNFLASTSGKGTHSPTVHGSNIATSGGEFLATTLTASGVGDFSQQFGTNSFLIDPTSVAKFYLANVGTTATGARIYDIGSPLALGADSALPATWTWDQTNSTLTYSVSPVPEPSTYGMLMAGLMAVGFMVRRRSAR